MIETMANLKNLFSIKISIHSILTDHPDLLTFKMGTKNLEVSGVSTPENSTPNTLCFLSQKSHLTYLESNVCSTWVIQEEIWKTQEPFLMKSAESMSKTVLICQNLQMTMAHILSYFDRRNSLLSFPQGISPQSWIHPSVKLSPSVTVGPFCTIGPDVQIGENSIIGPHSTIEGETLIGNNCYFESHVFIGRQTRVGNYCRFKPFASIGTDGYGYAPTSTGSLKIPQIGIVLIEDFVDIGSGTCIDRATLTQTRIGKGSKLDNLVHIAHNCNIGQYCFITAGFAVAGSSTIGDYFMTGGTTAVGDHVHITDKVTLAGASVVTGSIDKPGSYGGNPIQPLQENLRTRVLLLQLPKMRKNILKILKHLNLSES